MPVCELHGGLSRPNFLSISFDTWGAYVANKIHSQLYVRGLCGQKSSRFRADPHIVYTETDIEVDFGGDKLAAGIIDKRL